MAKENLPAIQLYPGDWVLDPIAGCSLAAQGLWLRMMFLAHKSDRYGYLELNGSPMPPETIARRCGCASAEYESLLSELIEAGVPSISSTGLVYSRRMVRDANLREKRRKAGSLGGRASPSKHQANIEQNTEVEDEDEVGSLFEEFWQAFPRGRKQSKPRAREAFVNALAKADAPTIIAAAKAYAASDVGRGQYVKMPSTWLNQECWNDDREAWRDRDGKQPACREYVQVTYSEFMDHFRAGEFNGKPGRRTPDADGFCWVYGQLKDGRKLESHNKPGWTPTP